MQISPGSYQALLSDHNLALLGDWLVETHELLVMINLRHSGGLSQTYIINSILDLRELLCAQTWPEIVVSIFREKQFPLRGRVTDLFIENALEMMADGKRYMIIKLRTYPDPCAWVDDGNSNQQMKESLEEQKDEFVGVGSDPFEPLYAREQDVHQRVFRLDVSKNQNYYEPFSKDPERYDGILAEWKRVG